jgi:hypothetical protein
MATAYMTFECMACGRMFERRWFDISREYERVHYKSPGALDEVEISRAESVGVFCSQACLNVGRGGVMQKQRVPIPPVRPGIGPVETCAKCSGPVDMSDWHLTYTNGECEEQEFSVSVLELDYVAVVCKGCLPMTLADGALQDGVVEEPKGRSSVVTGSLA